MEGLVGSLNTAKQWLATALPQHGPACSSKSGRIWPPGTVPMPRSTTAVPLPLTLPSAALHDTRSANALGAAALLVHTPCIAIVRPGALSLPNVTGIHVAIMKGLRDVFGPTVLKICLPCLSYITLAGGEAGAAGGGLQKWE
jgi:hypothetical protein